MSETNPTCQINQKYYCIGCQNPAWPGDPDGLCILHSQDKAKDPEAFKEALLARWDQEDSKTYDFAGIFFPGPFDPKTFFGSREFNKTVTFFEATFVDTALFIGATFAGEADFVSAKFIKGADFSGATFKDKAFFVDSTFSLKASFQKTSFIEKANFSKATFTEMERAFFLEATFMEEADFSGANFKGTAVFQGANFNKVSFSWAKLNKDVSFCEAIFAKEASFFLATFAEVAYFDWAVIEGLLVFRALNQPQEGKPQPQLFRGEFSNLQFSPGGSMRFQDLSLAYCKFKDTDLRQVEFHHVQWNPYCSRQAIFDEVLLRQDEKEYPWFLTWFWTWVSCHLPMRFFALESGVQLPRYLEEEFPPPDPPWGDQYGEVERLYRNLQENYKQAGDYKNLGDFHYGEMEMHRRASKWGWFPFSWYYLYRFLSGYGERPCRSLGWLAGFLLALPLLVWGFGLDRVPGGTSPGFLETFTYIFEKATFQRPPLLSNLNLLGRFISNLSLLILPGQAALFLLALRNRLGRRR